MSAEKLSRWSNPGWLTPAYRQSLPSLVRSNRNHQLGKLRVMKTALNMQTWEGKRHPEHLSSTCSKPILPSRFPLQLKCKSHMQEQAFVQQQHHCSCLGELQCYRRNTSQCCVYCMGRVFAQPCCWKQAWVFDGGSRITDSSVFTIHKCFIMLSVWRAARLFLPAPTFHKEIFLLLRWNMIQLQWKERKCRGC